MPSELLSELSHTLDNFIKPRSGKQTLLKAHQEIPLNCRHRSDIDLLPLSVKRFWQVFNFYYGQSLTLPRLTLLPHPSPFPSLLPQGSCLTGALNGGQNPFWDYLLITYGYPYLATP